MPKNELPRESFTSQLQNLRSIKDDRSQNKEGVAKIQEHQRELKLKEFYKKQKEIKKFELACTKQILKMLELAVEKLSLDDAEITYWFTGIHNRGAGSSDYTEGSNWWRIKLNWGEKIGHDDHGKHYAWNHKIEINIFNGAEGITDSGLKLEEDVYVIAELSRWENDSKENVKKLVEKTTLLDDNWKEKFQQWLIARLKLEIMKDVGE